MKLRLERDTYVDETIDKRVVAGVAHCQTVATQPDNVDVSVAVTQTILGDFVTSAYIGAMSSCEKQLIFVKAVEIFSA